MKRVDEGIFVRLDIKQRKPCGIMIVDFEKRFANVKTKPLPVEIENISWVGMSNVR